MKTSRLTTLLSAACVTACLTPVAVAHSPTYKMTTDIPKSITTPDRVETSIGKLEFFDGVPTRDTVESVYDYVDRARAVDVFINMIPAVSMYHLRQGMRDIGLTESNQILIAENMPDSKPLVLTWNNTSLYTWGFLDLKKDGPTVVELPPGVLGVFNDMYFRYMSDIGAAGPDKGKGGKYLVLPPDYKGDVPEGYFVVKSRTYGVWNFMRGYVNKGAKEATDRIKNNLKVYPLAKKDNPPKTEFTNMSGLPDYKTIPPNDFSYYESLNNLIQEEPLDFLDPETRGLIAAIGIVKGKPFSPDARMKKILTDAVAIGNAYARANTVFPRDPGHRVYKDSEWVMAFADKDTYFLKDGARRFDSRLWMHYNAVVVTPAMALTKPGAGSDYLIAGLDSKHQALDGGKTYRLHVPPKVPVKDNWSVTIYDTQTRSMLQTDQKFAGINSLGDGLKQNADGSYDVMFAPKLPGGVDERNWIQTIPGKSWFIIFRAYGPLEPWLDKSWRPSELELVSRPVSGAEGIDADADEILKSMSAYLGGTKAFSVNADIDLEVVTTAGQKVQLSSYATAVLERPSNFKISRKGVAADAAFIYDGNTLTLYGKNLNAYTQVKVPGTIDDAIHAYELETGIPAPGADLLFADPYAVLSSGVNSGVNLGTTYINGIECHHLAFREDEVDWQLWVQAGDMPLPMKYVITSKLQTAAPQYEIRFRDWDTSPNIPAGEFTFSPPEGAETLSTIVANEMSEVASTEESQ